MGRVASEGLEPKRLGPLPEAAVEPSFPLEYSKGDFVSVRAGAMPACAHTRTHRPAEAGTPVRAVPDKNDVLDVSF